MKRPPLKWLYEAEVKGAAIVFGYEAVALGFGPWLKKKFGINLPPLSDFAVLQPLGTGVLVGVLAYHLHEHYLQRNGNASSTDPSV